MNTTETEQLKSYRHDAWPNVLPLGSWIEAVAVMLEEGTIKAKDAPKFYAHLHEVKKDRRGRWYKVKQQKRKIK